MGLTLKDKIKLQHEFIRILHEKYLRTKDPKVKIELDIAKKELKQLERGK